MTIKRILSNLQKKRTSNKKKLILEMKEKNFIFKILKELKLLPFNKIEFLSINFTAKRLKNTMILSLNQVQSQNHKDHVELKRI